MRYILLSFLFIITLHAQPERIKIIKEILTSKDNINFHNITNSDLDNDKLEKYIKIIMDKNILKKGKYYLRVDYIDNELININTNYKIKNQSIFIALNKNTPQTLLFEFKKSPLFFLDIINKLEYKYILDDEKLLFGLAYGIIICAFLYNFVFYFYNRYKSFLYYSLLQVSLLTLLIFIALPIKIAIKITENINILDISLSLIMIFSILFNREFLNTKKHLPLVDKLLNIFLYLYIIDLILIFILNYSIMDEYFDTSAAIAILLLSAIVIYIKGYKPAIFYIFGWLIIFLVALFDRYDFLNISTTYFIHIGVPLESLIFSLALGYKVKQIQIDKQKNEQLLIHQNKLATTGEMINNISHQWRQPLMHISYILMNINNAFKHNKLDKEYLTKKTNLANKQLDHMSNTIDDFKNFYSIKKEKSDFFANDVINAAINISSAILKEHNIELFQKGKDFKIEGFKSELAQIILNIITNAKDAFIEKKITNPNITIELLNNQIKISDNAGGINVKTKEKIFEPYFTTKQKGSGIGLYMSKVIIQTHFNGAISHQNIKDGSCFTITFN